MNAQIKQRYSHEENWPTPFGKYKALYIGYGDLHVENPILYEVTCKNYKCDTAIERFKNDYNISRLKLPEIVLNALSGKYFTCCLCFKSYLMIYKSIKYTALLGDGNNGYKLTEFVCFDCAPK